MAMNDNEQVYSIKKLEAKGGNVLRVVELTITTTISLSEYQDLARAKWNGHPVYITLGQEPLRPSTEPEEQQDKDTTQRTLDQALEDGPEESLTVEDSPSPPLGKGDESWPKDATDEEIDRALADMATEKAADDAEKADDDADIHAQAARQAEAYHEDDDDEKDPAKYGWQCHIHGVREGNLDLKGITSTAKVAHLVYGESALCGLDFAGRDKSAFITLLGEMNLCQGCEKVHRGGE